MKITNVLSLFDGMSCGQIALERAGVKVENYFASELDKYAIKVARANYPSTIPIGDVRNVEGAYLPKIDLLIGGSPCQGFSFAGKQLNFDDPRSKLFFEYVRVLKECQPKYFLLENVVMKKEFQDVISRELGVEPIKINSALVSAQNRKRLYWTNIPGVTQPEDKGVVLRDILEDGVNTVGRVVGRRINPTTNKRDDYNREVPAVQRFEARGPGKSGALSTVQKDNVVLTGVVKSHGIRQPRPEKAQCIDANYFKGVDNHGQRTMVQVPRGNNPGGVKDALKSGTITSNSFEHNFKIRTKSKTVRSSGRNSTDKHEWDSIDDSHYRKLTPVECERLQTVPDGFTDHVSNTQRYKMLGNGWTVDVIAHIFGGIL